MLNFVASEVKNMTLEERIYAEVFERKPNLQSEVVDISAVNSIFYLLSINGCYDKNHDYDWKMYSDDVSFGPISLALWSDIHSNLKNHQNSTEPFSKDTKTVLHSMNRVLKNMDEDIDPRKVVIGMAGYKYISQNRGLSPRAVKLNFEAKMPELSGMCGFCQAQNAELEGRIHFINRQCDRTL